MTTDTREPIRVEELKWNTSAPQLWRDSWREADRVCRFKGRCVVCGRRTYAFDDGENDPRGVLGDHAASPVVARDYDDAGPDVPACFMCMNEEPSYRYALEHARRVWRASRREGVAP